jgi:hypothetical protein
MDLKGKPIELLYLGKSFTLLMSLSDRIIHRVNIYHIPRLYKNGAQDIVNYF